MQPAAEGTSMAQRVTSRGEYPWTRVLSHEYSDGTSPAEAPIEDSVNRYQTPTCTLAAKPASA